MIHIYTYTHRYVFNIYYMCISSAAAVAAHKIETLNLRKSVFCCFFFANVCASALCAQLSSYVYI